jgi:hypothetical protein
MNVCGREIKVSGRLIRTAHIDGEKYKFVDDPEPLVHGLRGAESRIDLFTFIQKLPETKPKYSYPMEWDNFAALPITTFEDWWTKQIDGKTRNMVRKSEKKGVSAREVTFDDAFARGIWEIYNECPVRQGTPFTHFGKKFETVRKEAATFLDSSIFIGTFLGERLIGFTKLTTDETQTQAGMMHIISTVEHRDMAPTNALIAQAVRSCAERGIKYLVYSTYSYMGKSQSSLSDFKKRNGFRRMDVPRYYVPLTGLGRVALRLGLNHRLAERFPEPIARKLRELREAWYHRKFQPVGGV